MEIRDLKKSQSKYFFSVEGGKKGMVSSWFFLGNVAMMRLVAACVVAFFFFKY